MLSGSIGGSISTVQSGDAPSMPVAADVSSLRIGYLVQQFPPEVGAGPARVLEMSRRWMARGAEVTVFTGMPNRPEGRIHPAYRRRLACSEDWEGIRTHRSWLYTSPRSGIGRTIANNASFMLTSGVSGAIQANGLDVLIASSPPFFPHISGYAVSRLRKLPLVLEVRDLWPDYLVGMGVIRSGSVAARTLFGTERWLLRRASAVTVVTESFRNRMIEKGVEPRCATVLPNGVDTAFYRRRTDAPPPFSALAPDPDSFTVGYLGNFGAGQALEAILRAAALVRRRDSRARFILAGDGPEGDRLRSSAQQPGMDRVTIHPPISKELTPSFYNHCDLLLVPLAPVPIFQETVPSKIFEALACERPVLASLEGEARRIVEHSGGGWSVEPGNPEAIAAGILKAAGTSESERRRMGKNGRSFVSQEFSRTVIADRYLELLEQVAHRP